ncbi:MAG: GTPase [Georgenia sp.]
MRLRTHTTDPVTALPADLERLREAVDLAGGHVPESALDPARELLLRAAQRQNLATGRTVVALLGATGSGKSSLFNALVGRAAARVAARRPTTSRPLAAVWGDDDAADLLDWLGVPERTNAGGGSGTGATTGGPAGGGREPADGLVLLDLPDIDSTAHAHREIAARMAGVVDVLVWVLDPQKYADAVVHRDYLAPMAAHADATFVVLNQVDTLAAADRAGVRSDLVRLLARDGLVDVPVLMTSARDGTGVAELRDRIAEVVDSKRAVQRRLAADVRTCATRLAGATARDGASDDVRAGAAGRAAGAGGSGTAPATTTGGPGRTLVQAAAQAAGVDAVTEATRGSYVRAARRSVGWPPLRWVARLRPDPLKRLHLGERAKDARLVRTSLPGPTPVQEAAVRASAHALVGRQTAHLPGQWRGDVLEHITSRIPALVASLDQQIAGTELAQARRPVWWRVLGLLQWLLLLAAIAGAGWLGALVGLDYLQLPEPKTPLAGPLPLPTVLLVGGAAGGILLAFVAGIAARVGGRRRARRVERLLRQAVADSVQEQLIDPLDVELDRYTRFREAVAALAG